MKITPETRKISEIFPIESSQRYVIPIYQRNYSWGSKQIETLIDDIDVEQSGYYIGNLLVTTNDQSEEEIVDGQQRLTTISLLLLAIYEISKKYESSDGLRVGSLQQDIKRKLLYRGNLDLPRYSLLANDNEIYKDLLKVLDNQKPNGWKKRRFGIRYNFIKETLSEKFKNYNELYNFYEKLNDLEILKISVTKLSDAFSIFTALNSKGLPLTLVDLLKNEYLRRARKESIKEDIALNNWESLIEVFLNDEDVNIFDVTQFLLNNYDSLENTERRSITKSEALELYINLINKGSSYIYDLKSRAYIFDFIKNASDSLNYDDTIKQRIQNLSLLDHSQSFPLLLLLFVSQKELNLDIKTMEKILDTIIAFFVRRNITLRPKASNVRATFISINRDIRNDNLKDSQIYELIKKELSKNIDNDDTIINMLQNEGLYDKSPGTVRFVLIDLERRYGAYFNKSNPDTLDQYVTNKGKKPILRWTIEHILPQNTDLPDYWKDSIFKDDESKTRLLHEENVHKLGNLTITPYNSELGQKSFKEKMNKMDGQSYVGLRLPFFINESIIDTNEGENWDNKMVWDIENINRRTKELAKVIIDTYKI